MSKETVKQYIRNQYTGKEQCQFLPQMNQQDSLAHSSLKICFHRRYLVTFCNNACRFLPVLYVSYSAASKRASKGFALRAFSMLPDCQLCALQDNIPSVVATVVLVVVITYCMQYILTAAFSSRF